MKILGKVRKLKYEAKSKNKKHSNCHCYNIHDYLCN